MSRRRIVKLGDVLSENRPRIAVESDGRYPMLGVFGFGRGVILRNEMMGSSISATHLYRVASHQIIFSRLKAFEGAFALVPPHADGRFVTNEFPTFDVDIAVALPDYVALILGQPTTWNALAARITGMGSRRERLRSEAFLEFEIELPTVDQQRAIVTAAGALTGSHSAAVQRLAALGELDHAVLSRYVDGSSGVAVAVSELVVGIDAGRSPKCLNRPPECGEYGVLKVSSVRPGRFVPSESKALPADVEPHLNRTIRDGDVLVSRANTQSLVGSACRVSGDHPHLLLCDKTLRFTLADQKVDPDFFVAAMSAPNARMQIELAASGTSESMVNVSQAALREIELPVPGLTEQRRIVAILRSIASARDALEAEVLALLQLQTSVVSGLLAGDVNLSGQPARSNT